MGKILLMILAFALVLFVVILVDAVFGHTGVIVLVLIGIVIFIVIWIYMK